MKKTIFVFMLILTFIVTSLTAFASSGDKKNGSLYFNDISHHWAKDTVNQMVEKGILEADADGKFFPNKNMTRSEFVPLIHKALGISIQYFKAPDIKEFFEDVNNEDVYASPLYDLVIANIIDFKGEFNPESTITREEMAHYIMNAYKYKAKVTTVEVEQGKNYFKDSEKVSDQYKDDVNGAAMLGLVKGRGNNKFFPKDKITRAETITIISRLMNAFDKKNSSIEVKPSFELDGDVYRMKLAITNNSDTEVVINHTSGQKYDFKLLDGNKKVLYCWSADKFFTMALGKTTVAAGETLEFAEELDVKSYKDIVDNARYLVGYVTGISDDFRINPDGYETRLYTEEQLDPQAVPDLRIGN